MRVFCVLCIYVHLAVISDALCHFVLFVAAHSDDDSLEAPLDDRAVFRAVGDAGERKKETMALVSTGRIEVMARGAV